VSLGLPLSRITPERPVTSILNLPAICQAEREAAVAAPAPIFLARYSHADVLAHRRCIYALLDPRTDKVMYVGQTVGHVLVRLEQHISGIGRNPVPYPSQRWIAELLMLGLTPTAAVLEVVPPKADLSVAEQAWIRFYKYRGEAEHNREVVMARLYGLEPKARPDQGFRQKHKRKAGRV
jgi:hypothetical protein